MMHPCLRVTAVLLFLLAGCANREQPAPEPPVETTPPLPPPISLEEQQERQAIAASSGLMDYILDDFSIVVGIRPRSLIGSSSGKEEIKEAQEIADMLARLGLDPEKVEVCYSGSNPSEDDVLVVLRVTGSLDESKVKQNIKPQSEEQVAGESVLAIAKEKESDPDNGLCFVKNRTVLVGRLKTVKRALEQKRANAANPLRNAEKALAKASAPFWVSVSDGLAKVAMAESIIPGMDAKEFETVQSFAMTISEEAMDKELLREKQIQVAFTFERSSQAEQFAKVLEEGMEKYEKALQETRVARQEVASKGKQPPPEGDEQSTQNSSQSQLESHSTSSSAQANQKKDSDDKENIKVSGSIVRLNIVYRDGNMGPAISKAIGLARGANPVSDGVFRGSLASFHSGFSGFWNSSDSALFKGVRKVEEKPLDVLYVHYSWMCSLLPHLKHYDIYDRINFEKDWTAEGNFELTFFRIPEFLNPAARRDRWQGYPFHGMALTHFVGMAGVESGLNELAATYPREDPRAGIFGYDRILRSDEVTDGLNQTILMIGAEGVAGPWVQAGGSTIRGARKPHFDEFTGFHSAGAPDGGTYVLMADGSMRFISKDIDPKVFEAMCTAHGGEQVDLSATLNLPTEE